MRVENHIRQAARQLDAYEPKINVVAVLAASYGVAVVSYLDKGLAICLKEVDENARVTFPKDNSWPAIVCLVRYIRKVILGRERLKLNVAADSGVGRQADGAEKYCE